MRKTLVAGSALAGGLLMSTLVWGSAQATSAPDLKNALVSLSSVTLVGRGGGGGNMGGMGGGRVGGMGGGHVGGMGGGRVGGVGHISGGSGGRIAVGGGGSRSFSSRSLSGGSGHNKSMSGGTSHFKTGRIAGGDITGPRNFSKRNFNNGPGVKGRDRFAESNWKGGKNWRDHDKKHVAMRDHDHDKFNHFNRHRVFRNGVWFWAYGLDYYAGDNCLWLLRRAQATGSNYWWSRYNACVGYY